MGGVHAKHMSQMRKRSSSRSLTQRLTLYASLPTRQSGSRLTRDPANLDLGVMLSEGLVDARDAPSTLVRTIERPHPTCATNERCEPSRLAKEQG